MNKILSQDEVSALLNDVKVHNKNYASTNRERKNIQHYDFKHPDRISKDQLRVLKTIHSNFTKSFGTYLSAKLRTTVDVSVLSVDQLSYTEFMMTMTAPTCIYIVEVATNSGSYIIEFTPEFVFYTIDRLLGGSGEVFDEAREITIIEENVLKKIAQKAIIQLDDAWQSVTSFNSKIASFETNPQFVQIAPASEPSVVISFSVKVHNFSSIITLCFPYFVLEPVLPRLNIQSWISLRHKGATPESSPLIEKGLLVTPIEMVASRTTSKITMSEIMNLEIGDVILFDDNFENQFQLVLSEQPMFLGKVGVYGKRRAIKITDIIENDERLKHDRS